MKKWTEQELEFLKNNYIKMSYKELANYLGRSIPSVKHKAERNNLNMPRRWTEQDIEYLKQNFKTMSYKKLAIDLNRTKAAVDCKVNELGLIKSPYQYNHSFFNTVDTEEKAYWCGFILADGCVSYNTRTNSCEVCIKLQHNDYQHLKKFNKSVAGNVPVTFVERPSGFSKSKISKSCMIRFYSQEMMHDLEKYGVIPNKSIIKQFPVNINNSLMRHFIRGYFDGNGSFIIESKSSGNKYARFRFCSGSEDFLQGLQSYFIANTDIKVGRITKSKTSHTFYCSINARDSVISFYHFLYDDSTIYLDRKFQKVQTFFN